MSTLPDILAESDAGGVASFVVFVIFAVLVAVSKWVKAAKEKADAERKRQEQPPQARRPDPAQQPAPRPRYDRATQTPKRPPRQSDPLMRTLEGLGIVPPDPRLTPPPLEIADEETHSVKQELQRQETRRVKILAQRQKRLGTLQSSEADSVAIQDHLLSIHGGEDAHYRGPPVTGNELADVDAARHAMVYHEIFSPPKALREAPEIWDL